MKKLFSLLVISFLIILASACNADKNGDTNMDTTIGISQDVINSVIDELTAKYGKQHKIRIEKGITQIAKLWVVGKINADDASSALNFVADGTADEFRKFCIDNFVSDSAKLEQMFQSIQTHFEVLYGHFNKISLDLKRPTQLDGYAVSPIDELIAGYEPIANLQNDFYQNKIAFVIALNFPYYTLKEKEEQGEKWTRQQWAYIRLGDIFTTRIPSTLMQKYSESIANADFYISNYNIYMGYLENEGTKYFPEDMKLISHWNLRDEIKSLYAEASGKDANSAAIGLKKQKMILDVMLRIIKQEIPQEAINNNQYTWNPTNNKVFKDGKEYQATTEPNTRYQHLLNHFKLNLQMDKYRQSIGNAINETFDVTYEMPQEYVEKMYVEFISSPQVKQVAKLIKSRLGRELQPFDIWYDGFKSRSTLDADMLNKKTKALYPNTLALEKGIPSILTKLGFTSQKANEIASHISVDPSKGAGHAWGADMKGEKAHLRTRIGAGGMDYKGYNIAVHELGHNVEQTLSLYDIDNWFMRGVPNTAFTEAWAFVYQAKDLQLLGFKNNNPENDAMEILDKFWSCYEIMGVSLIDQRIWKWMYANPTCTAEDLKNATIQIANEVWNSYYAPVFGIKDCPILAIYSHMIDYPLYLSAYPLGHLIEFQMSEYMKNKNVGQEMTRIVTQGRLLPDIWMKQAVGDKVSIKPLLDAVAKVVSK